MLSEPSVKIAEVDAGPGSVLAALVLVLADKGSIGRDLFPRKGKVRTFLDETL